MTSGTAKLTNEKGKKVSFDNIVQYNEIPVTVSDPKQIKKVSDTKARKSTPTAKQNEERKKSPPVPEPQKNEKSKIETRSSTITKQKSDINNASPTTKQSSFSQLFKSSTEKATARGMFKKPSIDQPSSPLKSQKSNKSLGSNQTSTSSLDMKDMESLPPETDTQSIDILDITSGTDSTEKKYQRLREVYLKQREIKHKMGDENKQLRRHVAVLNKRLVRDIGKSHVSAKMPSNVEASLNLRYQFMKKLESEKTKYDYLVEENRRLSWRIKELEDELAKKMNEKRDTTKTNEILYWKNKYRDLEKEKQKVEDALKGTIRQLEKEAIQHEKLKGQLEVMKLHFSALAPKAVQMFEAEYEEWLGNKEKNSKFESSRSEESIQIVERDDRKLTKKGSKLEHSTSKSRGKGHD